MPKRTAELEERPAEPDRTGVHPLLSLPIVESLHAVAEDGAAACADNEDLCPGHNCCATCAEEEGASELLPCPACKKVHYCSEEHRVADQAEHEQVCRVLCYVVATEAVDVALDTDALLPFVEAAGATLAAGRTLASWADCVPAAYAAVFPASGTAAAASGGHVDRSKRHRSAKPATDASGSQEPPAAANGSAANGGGEVKATAEEGGAVESSKLPSPVQDEHLEQAAEMAAATGYLTYPMTLLHAVERYNSMQHAASVAQQQGRPFVVTVLGASSSAELAHVNVWKVLGSSSRLPSVLLQFVGLDVAEELHQQARKVSDAVEAAFWRGTFEELLECAGARPPVLPEQLASKPDAVVGFNMGLTCPDYGWAPTLEALYKVFKAKCVAQQRAQQQQAAATNGNDTATPRTVRLPWLVTANTRIESEIDGDFLKDNLWKLSQGGGVADNPLKALEVLQSGTLANDVYRKNAWLSCYELAQRPHLRLTPMGKLRRWVGKAVSALKSPFKIR